MLVWWWGVSYLVVCASQRATVGVAKGTRRSWALTSWWWSVPPGAYLRRGGSNDLISITTRAIRLHHKFMANPFCICQFILYVAQKSQTCSDRTIYNVSAAQSMDQSDHSRANSHYQSTTIAARYPRHVVIIAWHGKVSELCADARAQLRNIRIIAQQKEVFITMYACTACGVL